MELSAAHIALFDAFIRKELTPEERLNFTERLENDSDFKAQFETFQGFEQDLEDAEITAFQDKLKQWDKAEEAIPKKKTRIIPMRFIAIAASLLVLIGVSIFYFAGQANHQELVAAHFEPYDNVLTVRGEKEELDDGLQKYEVGEYQAAITIFERYPSNVNAQFYAGESYLALNEFEAAIGSYKNVLKSSGIFNEIAEFHMALSYIGKDAIEDAKEALAAIQKESDYYANAQELLEELE